MLGLALILAQGFADDKLCDKEHMKPINLETGRTDFIKARATCPFPFVLLFEPASLQGPELDINYKVEISNLKVQNDGKVLKVVGFKSSSIKYRTTTYQLEEVGSCELLESM